MKNSKSIKVTNKKWDCHIIITFDKDEQKIFNLNVSEESMVTKEDFLSYIVKKSLSKKEITQLVKISVCQNNCSDFKKSNPSLFEHYIGDDGWLMKYNGKFYVQCGDFFTIYEEYDLNPKQSGGEFKTTSETLSKTMYKGIKMEVIMKTTTYTPSPIILTEIELKDEVHKSRKGWEIGLPKKDETKDEVEYDVKENVKEVV